MGQIELQVQNEVELEERHSIDPWSLYLYAMKSPVTREKYTGRLSKFLEYVSLEGKNVEEQAKEFVRKSNSDRNWAFATIVKFFHSKPIDSTKEKFRRQLSEIT